MKHQAKHEYISDFFEILTEMIDGYDAKTALDLNTANVNTGNSIQNIASKNCELKVA
ncbi:hypothetical protein [Fusibacter tunisiensis]|uniref:Uncharacterized protein n=1 Tax=Fusibacter tunisiensis TaxID=1008308 RepID=A0ABS2MTX4_9FIRM|nr:hypothetical protein [Fusibacter tunisiensis]MBM7562844.1 hypothetical protein [Fusibacter tunisiensis]